MAEQLKIHLGQSGEDTLASSITSSATSVVVTTGGNDAVGSAGMSASVPFDFRIGTEILRATAYTSGTKTYTVTRGMYGTTAVAHNGGDICNEDLSLQALLNLILERSVRRNLLVNGGFKVWQRGTGPFTANNAYTADRWQIFPGGGTNALSVSSDTTTPDPLIPGGTDLAGTFTKGTGTYGETLQYVEGPNLFVGKTVSLSIRVKTSTANAVQIMTQSNGTGGVDTLGAFHSGSGNYETLTATIAFPADSTYWGFGIAIQASCSYNFGSAMLVDGAVPMDYLGLTAQGELARCQRYYEIIGVATGTGDLVIAGIATAATQAAYLSVPCAVPKAVNPTVTVVGTWTNSNTSGNPAIGGSSQWGVRLNAVSLAAGPFLTYNGSAGEYITVLANP